MVLVASSMILPLCSWLLVRTFCDVGAGFSLAPRQDICTSCRISRLWFIFFFLSSLFPCLRLSRTFLSPLLSEGGGGVVGAAQLWLTRLHIGGAVLPSGPIRNLELIPWYVQNGGTGCHPILGVSCLRLGPV